MVKIMATLIGGVKVPEFGSEADEALWWDEHRAEVEQNLGEAMRGGSAQRGTAQRLMREARASKNITIRMPLADLERARQLSSKKGLGYQTYVKMLLHEALDREEKHGTA
jgi:predicted DNA binding CopG/RHH family protein